MQDIAHSRITHFHLGEGFVEANRRFAASESRGLQDALQYIVQSATRYLEPCDWAAVTEWPQNKAPFSSTATDDIAARVDAIQYSLMEGPCLEAAGRDELVRIPDLEDSQRWPRFCAAVVAELPVRSALAYPLGERADRIALSLYSARPNAFVGAALMEQAAMFANQATALLMHARTAQRAQQFEGGMESNRQIGTAIGVLMALRHVTSGDAFEMLKNCSNRTKRKVRDVAIDVIETGEVPG